MAGRNRSKRAKVRSNPTKAQFAPGLADIVVETARLALLRKYVNSFGRYHFDLDRVRKPQASSGGILSGGFRLDVATTPTTSQELGFS